MNPWTILTVFVIVFLIFAIRSLYINIARRIKIIEGITKSPIFTQLSTALYGLSTIRAFKMQKKFESRFDTFQNDHSSAWFFYISASRWLLFYTDLSSSVLVCGVTFSMLILGNTRLNLHNFRSNRIIFFL